MGSQRRIVLKPVALLLAFAVLQVYVLVTPVRASAATDTTSTNNAPANVRFGQLLMSGSQSALVNGTSAITGTTIFSGAQLQTPDGVTATVNLGTLGRISIEPNTSLSLTFDKENVDVQVSAGNALLTTSEGVNGTLTTAEGQKLMTNAAANSTVGRTAAKRRMKGDHLLGLVLTATVITIALIALAVDDDDDSPSRP